MGASRPGHELSTAQQALVSELTRELSSIPGVEAIVLGGSFARGFAQPDSDIDLGLLYSESAPFEISRVRSLAERVDDAPRPVVTDFYEWGPWVNGGAWLTIRGQRVDFLYRSLEHLERVISAAEEGRYESHYDQQPPFGFFGPSYLGEILSAVPLFDPSDRLGPLKSRAAVYPEALLRRVVEDQLWAVEFGISGFAVKYAARGSVFLTAASLARFGYQLVLTIFALNRRYPVNDKTVLTEIERFAIAPPDFSARVEALLARPGETPEQLMASVDHLRALLRETVDLAGDLYRPRALP